MLIDGCLSPTQVFLSLIATAGAFSLPSAARLLVGPRCVAKMSIVQLEYQAAEQDGCVLTHLEGYASSVFGKHRPMDAWVCPESERAAAKSELECLYVMHDGDLIWACDPEPVKFKAARLEALAASEADKNLFEKIRRIKLKVNYKLNTQLKRLVVAMPPMA